jgi:hypothetical protein
MLQKNTWFVIEANGGEWRVDKLDLRFASVDLREINMVESISIQQREQFMNELF